MKKTAVLGFGKSGKSAYKALKLLGEEVFVFDDNYINTEDEHFFTGDKSIKFYDFDFDEIVVSPGIKKSHPFIEYSLSKGVKVISELELGFTLAKCPIIAITGTNGKTTTVTLINKILNASGKKSIPCGNYGFPLTEASLMSDNLDYLVVEVSSFQLEFIDKFKPFIAAIINVGSDHLKWHGSKEEYMQSKLKIFKNQTKGDYFIKNSKDSYVYDRKGRVLSFSCIDKTADCFLDKNKIVVNFKDNFIIDNTKLFGYANNENVSVAALVALLCNVDKKIILGVVRNMDNLPNRIEYVDEIEEVKFYNDSKSTNVDSVVNALNSFKDEKIVLILGGKHKGESFSKILDLLTEKARAVVIYGEDKKVIANDLKDLRPIPLFALDVHGAVRGAFEVAARGDVVLFSPGGSSCEPYSNYEERGKDFKEYVKSYKQEYESA